MTTLIPFSFLLAGLLACLIEKKVLDRDHHHHHLTIQIHNLLHPHHRSLPLWFLFSTSLHLSKMPAVIGGPVSFAPPTGKSSGMAIVIAGFAAFGGFLFVFFFFFFFFLPGLGFLDGSISKTDDPLEFLNELGLDMDMTLGIYYISCLIFDFIF